MKKYILAASIFTLSSLMGSVQIDNDPTFTDADRNAFRTLYGADDSASIKGPKINRQDFYGKTPLYSACEFGRTSVALFLLKKFTSLSNCSKKC